MRRADFLARQNAMFKYSINITLKMISVLPAHQILDYFSKIYCAIISK